MCRHKEINAISYSWAYFGLLRLSRAMGRAEPAEDCSGKKGPNLALLLVVPSWGHGTFLGRVLAKTRCHGQFLTMIQETAGPWGRSQEAFWVQTPYFGEQQGCGLLHHAGGSQRTRFRAQTWDSQSSQGSFSNGDVSSLLWDKYLIRIRVKAVFCPRTPRRPFTPMKSTEGSLMPMQRRQKLRF